jgi:hypothetical protein
MQSDSFAPSNGYLLSHFLTDKIRAAWPIYNSHVVKKNRRPRQAGFCSSVNAGKHSDNFGNAMVISHFDH